MKRVDALRSLMGCGIQRVDIMADFDGDPIVIDAGMAIKLYSYLDEDLCDPKAELQKPKEKQQKPKEKQRRTRRVEIDMGKVHALHNAGWTYEKIADEVDVNVNTLYARLKEERDENNAQ